MDQLGIFKIEIDQLSEKPVKKFGQLSENLNKNGRFAAPIDQLKYGDPRSSDKGLDGLGSVCGT